MHVALRCAALSFSFGILTLPSAVWAACSTPAATEGTLLFNSTSGQMQFCKHSGYWHGLASAPGLQVFSPAQLGTLAAWYNPESLSGYSDGAAITGWTDSSGNGHNLAPIGTDAPTVTTSGIGGLKSLVIDSHEDRTKTSMGTLLQNAHTYYLVAKPTGTAVDYGPVLGYTDSSVSNNGGAAIFYKNNASYATYAAYSFGGNDDGFSSWTTNTPDVIAVVMDEGTGEKIYKNGTLISTIVASGSFPSHDTMVLTTQAGAGSRYFQGQIAEVVMLSHASDDTERQMVEGYLAHKYGLAASLPGGHPYKSVAP